MNGDKTTERKAAGTILGVPQTVELGGRTYSVAPPTLGTLMEVSAAISELPAIDRNAGNVAAESLAKAADCGALGDIAAILILGGREYRQAGDTRHKAWKRRFFPNREKGRTKGEALAEELRQGVGPAELQRFLAGQLSRMELGDFFGLTAFLAEVNLLRPTRAVVTDGTDGGRATAPGD